MAHKPWRTAGFVTVCCSMTVVSKTLCSHFSSQGSYYGYTYTWTKLVMSWISGAYECHYAWPLHEANSTTVRDLTVPSVSSLPLSVMVHSCHVCINLSRLHFRLLSHRHCALAGSPLPTAGWEWQDYEPLRTFYLREMFKCTHLKFTVYGRKQASKQTYTRTWLAPIIKEHTHVLPSPITHLGAVQLL